MVVVNLNLLDAEVILDGDLLMLQEALHPRVHHDGSVVRLPLLVHHRNHHI
jgi:hypothetical protein